MLDGFVSLMAPSETGFTFSLLIPDSLFTKVPESESDPDPRKDPVSFKKQLLEQIAAKDWRIDWIGVEG